MGVLGSIHATLGEYDEAINCFNQSLDIAQEIGNKRSEGILYGNLEIFYIRLRQWSDAEVLLMQGIEVCESIIPAAAGAFMGSFSLGLCRAIENGGSKVPVDGRRAIGRGIS